MQTHFFRWPKLIRALKIQSYHCGDCLFFYAGWIDILALIGNTIILFLPYPLISMTSEVEFFVPYLNPVFFRYRRSSLISTRKQKETIIPVPLLDTDALSVRGCPSVIVSPSDQLSSLADQLTLSLPVLCDAGSGCHTAAVGPSS